MNIYYPVYLIDLIFIILNFLLFLSSLSLCVLLLTTKTFAWNIRIVLISSTMSSLVYLFLVSFRAFNLVFVPSELWYSLIKFLKDANDYEARNLFKEYYVNYRSIESIFLSNVLWHIFPISLDRLLLLYDSYKNKKHPYFTFINVILTYFFAIKSVIFKNLARYDIVKPFNIVVAFGIPIILVAVIFLSRYKYKKLRWNEKNYQDTVNVRLNYVQERLVYLSSSVLLIMYLLMLSIELSKQLNIGRGLLYQVMFTISNHYLNILLLGETLFYGCLLFGSDTEIRRKLLRVLSCSIFKNKNKVSSLKRPSLVVKSVEGRKLRTLHAFKANEESDLYFHQLNQAWNKPRKSIRRFLSSKNE